MRGKINSSLHGTNAEIWKGLLGFYVKSLERYFLQEVNTYYPPAIQSALLVFRWHFGSTDVFGVILILNLKESALEKPFRLCVFLSILLFLSRSLSLLPSATKGQASKEHIKPPACALSNIIFHAQTPRLQPEEVVFFKGHFLPSYSGAAMSKIQDKIHKKITTYTGTVAVN